MSALCSNTIPAINESFNPMDFPSFVKELRIYTDLSAELISKFKIVKLTRKSRVFFARVPDIPSTATIPTNRTSVIRAQFIVDITTAKDEKGKPIYSNEKLREAALNLKLEENEEYQELTEKGWELDTEESTLATEHNRLVGRKVILMM